ncbi:carbonyl reductase family member 4 isoform X2 [Chanodichthys erythropterus]|uniref:carbonyl reductase family member 4 isoform X2 n=1 Tax=Chanodichthys erythropterus TaxID=933992 RepID=UPI00351E7532
MSRLAVVFGGSRGIGRAVSQLLAQRGHRVVVLSRNKEASKATAESLPGEKHLSLSCDVSKEEDVQRAFETISKNCGTVGYLVNAAGINRDALLLRSKSEDMLSVLHTNLLGSMLTCRGALRSMLSHGGAIVNIGSVVGVKGNSGQCVYSASKAGLEGFTRSLAKEVSTRNIRVNLVAPGWLSSFSLTSTSSLPINLHIICHKNAAENSSHSPLSGFIQTDMTEGLEKEAATRRIPLGRFGEPAEVAQAVLFLLESPYITGQVLLVDGGLRLAL